MFLLNFNKLETNLKLSFLIFKETKFKFPKPALKEIKFRFLLIHAKMRKCFSKAVKLISFVKVMSFGVWFINSYNKI